MGNNFYATDMFARVTAGRRWVRGPSGRLGCHAHGVNAAVDVRPRCSVALSRPHTLVRAGRLLCTSAVPKVPVVAQKGPYEVKVEVGKKYFW